MILCPLHKVLLGVIIHIIYLYNYFVVGPNITSPPVNQTIVDPNPATFNCEAEGLPRPDISWFKIQNDMVMEIASADSNFTVSTVNGTGDRQVMSTLKVDIVRPALAAMYICNASNVVRSITAAAILIVHSKSLFLEVKNFISSLFCHVAVPRIVSPQELSVVVINQFQPAMFVCSAVGIPAPQFVWMRTRGNQNETLSDTPSLIISISESENYQLEYNRGSVFRVNSTLGINEALDDDSGSYFCVANSTPGTDSQEFQLVVQGGNYLKKCSLCMILKVLKINVN